MESIKNYIVESYNELVHKVTWPTWKELQGSGVVVLVASAVIGLIILGMDLASKNATELIYEILMG